MKKLLAATTCVVLGLLTVGSPAARAADSASIVLSDLTPAYLNQPQTLQLTLLNNSDSDLVDAIVTVNQSTNVLQGRSDITSIRQGKGNFSSQLIVRTAFAVVAAHENFTVTVPRSSLQLKASGVYVLTVKIASSSISQKINVLLPFRTFSATGKPLKIVTLWSVSAAPAFTADGQIINDTAADTFGVEGSANAIVTAAKNQSQLTWLIDPDTVATAQKIVDGVDIAQPDVHGTSSDQRANAQSWLENLKLNSENATVYSLPFANADINTLLTHKLSNLALAAVTNTGPVQTLLQRADIARAVIAPRGDFSDIPQRWIRNQRLHLTIVKSNRYPSIATSFTADGLTTLKSGRKALVADVQASAEMSASLLGGPNTLSERQAFLSDLLMIEMEQPSNSRTLVLLPNTWQAGISEAATAATLGSLRAPWTLASSVTDTLTRTPTADRKRQKGTIGTEISDATLKTIKDIDNRRIALKGLIAATSVEADAINAELRLASNSFTSQTQRGQLRSITLSHLAWLDNAVKIMTSGSVIFPREKSVVPITIRNDLPIAVTVRVTAIGEPQVRVIPDVLEVVTIQPGKRKSIEIATRLVGSDVAYLQIQLRDINGQKIGAPARIELSSSAYSGAAAWIVAISFVLLLILIAVNTVRRIRVRRVASRNSSSHE